GDHLKLTRSHQAHVEALDDDDVAAQQDAVYFQPLTLHVLYGEIVESQGPYADFRQVLGRVQGEIGESRIESVFCDEARIVRLQKDDLLRPDGVRLQVNPGNWPASSDLYHPGRSHEVLET